MSLRYSGEFSFEPLVERCEICLYNLTNPWTHSECRQHIFCLSCITTYLEMLITDSKVLHIKCPGSKCIVEFSDEEIKEIVDTEMFSKYLKFKVRAELLVDPEIKWCIQPDCEGFIRGSPRDKMKPCPVCGFKICFQCGKNWHPKKTCEDVVDADYELWARGREIQMCPKCKHRIEKVDGCNHMTCAACSYNWCWLCRGHYTSNHFSPLNPFGCPNLQGGYHTRDQWPMWKIYLKRCKGLCIWFWIIIFFPLILLFGPGFRAAKYFHDESYGRGALCQVSLDALIFIGVTIITPPGYALLIPFLIIYGFVQCIKRC